MAQAKRPTTGKGGSKGSGAEARGSARRPRPGAASKYATPRNRRADGLATRARVLEAAAEVFARDGFEGTSLRGIAETAGIDIATLKYHFGDKAALFSEVYRDGYEHFQQALGPQLLRVPLARNSEELEKEVKTLLEKAYDYLFPWFVMTSLPAGVKGLVTVGIFATAMGSLDSAMNALATTTTRCVLAPWLARGRPDAYYVTASRWLTVFFAAVLAGVAVLVWLLHDPGSQEKGFGVLALGLEVLTWIFPPLLGVHLLGALTRRGSDRGNLLALTVGIGLILAARFSQDLFGLPSPWVWSWNAVIGCAVTFGIGALFPGRGHEEIPA